MDNDPTTLFDLERLRLRTPLPAQVLMIGEARPRAPVQGPRGRQELLTVRRAGVLRRQFALRNDPLPDDDEPVVTVRVRVDDGVELRWVRSPEELPASEFANIALTCARNEKWRSRWGDVLGQLTEVTILIDTPFSQSLDALLVGTTGFRYAVEPILGGTHLFAYVCAVDNARPLVLPCTLTRASALRLHTQSRTSGQPPADLAAVVDRPAAVLSVMRRIVGDESVVEHQS